MGILPQYGVSFYHRMNGLSMNIFHNHEAFRLVFLLFIDRTSLREPGFLIRGGKKTLMCFFVYFCPFLW